MNAKESALRECYESYLKACKLMDLAKKEFKCTQLQSIIERYLICRANKYNPKEKLRRELREMAFKSHLYNKIIGIIENYSYCGKLPCLTVDINPSRAKLTFGDFIFEIPVERYSLMRRLAEDDDILRAALRYASLLPSSQQWSIPFEEYREIIERFSQGKENPRIIEGFASPFTSQIMMLPGPKRGFCSLFPEDVPFGSLGNFFQVNINDSLVVVNPPFIESVLLSAAKKCLESNCSFVFNGPNWTDAEFYKLLEKEGVKKEVLNKGTYVYEDLCKEKIIKTNFNSVRFSNIKY